MDEILIEEKKYVSSKQAAKLTGYAKDYIGQLCREGRVPARLVGRSWYVLESAIQDHRFGNQATSLVNTTDNKEKGSKPLTSVVDQTWESPKYEADHADLLPTVNRLRAEPPVSEVLSEAEEIIEETALPLQNSWQSWFNDTDATKSVMSAETIAPNTRLEAREEEGQVEDSSGDVEAVNVPVHAIHRQIVREEPEVAITSKVQSNWLQLILWSTALQITGACVAVVAVALAILGSGYFDSYIFSNNQVQFISGVSIYNR